MRIRQACASMLLAASMLLFAVGASQAEQSQSGSRAGTEKSEPVIGSNPSKGPSDLRLFDEHGPFNNYGPYDGGKIGQRGPDLNLPRTGGEVSRGGGGSGSAPAHSFGESRTGSSAGSMPGSHSGTGSMGSFGGGHSGAFGGR